MALSGNGPWLVLALGWFVMAVIMAALWVYQPRTHNAGFVDICRAVGTALLAIVFALPANAIASRGDACRAYQRTTNAFFPGPPRPDPEAST